MGFVVLHLLKPAGTDAAMTAHIERTIAPSNANSSLTHLNRKLIDHPDGVGDRTEAIQHRLDSAGLQRKIGKNQRRAFNVMLSGTHEDMKRIEAMGKLDQWCDDNLDWLRKTYGTENVVSAVLHLDEKSPHIHATVVPIVTAERKKKKSEMQAKKRYRTKSPTSARLCLDDVMSREKLKEYQDTYAEAMAKYGLQRGIDGSEARHISTSQWYRDLSVQNGSLKENIRELIQQKEQAERELSKTKNEIKTEKLKSTAVDVGTSIVEGIGSVIGTSKVKKQQQDIDNLKTENAEIKEKLGNEITQLKAHIRTTEAEHKSTIGKLSEKLDKIYTYFPHLENLLNWEKFLRDMGLPQDMVRRLFNREEVVASGELNSKEHSKKFKIEKASLKLEQDKEKASKIHLTINGTDIFDWFRQKQQEFLKAIGINIEQKQGRGITR